MAIDTYNKKRSLITLLQPWNTPIPRSSDGLDVDDMKHLMACYAGLEWGALSPPAEWTDVIFTGLLVDSIGQDRIVTLVGKFKAR